MTTQMEVFLDQLQKANTLSDISNIVHALRDAYGLTHAVYHIVGSSGREFGAFTYSTDWVEHYKNEALFRTDPVVLECLRSFHPLDWRTLDWTTSGARKLITEAVDAGIGKQGLSVPIRGTHGQFAMFSVTSYDTEKQWETFLAQYTRDILLAAHYIHGRAVDIMNPSLPTTGPDLSPRERDVLSLLSLGNSRAQASEKLKISEHTFRVYVDTARHKLGAANTTHAVALAMSGGMLL